MKRSPHMSTSDILNFQSALHKEWLSLPGWISRELSIWWKRISSFFCLLSVASCTLWVLFHFSLKHFLFVCVPRRGRAFRGGDGGGGGGEKCSSRTRKFQTTGSHAKTDSTYRNNRRLFIRLGRHYLIQIQGGVRSL